MFESTHIPLESPQGTHRTLNPVRPGCEHLSMSTPGNPREGRSDPVGRRAQAQQVIDQILHGTPDGRVDPALSENLRKHLAENPGDPDRALFNHIKEQMPDLNIAFPEDLK